MKILHTSDWHIGKRLHGHDLLHDQIRFLKWLSNIMLEEKIDILIVAGDIYDVSSPSLMAHTVLNNFLAECFKQNYPKKVIITDGNHDGRALLQSQVEILKPLDIHLICSLSDNMNDHFIEYESDNDKVVICAVPYLRDQDINRQSVNSNITRAEEIKNGITDIYQQFAELTSSKYNSDYIKIVTGHLFVQGSSANDDEAERPLQIGLHEGVRSSIFSKQFDYVALGHIHNKQQVKGDTKIYYSGAPYPLNFGERDYKNKCVLLSVSNNDIKEKYIDVPVCTKLRRIDGSFAKVKEHLEKLKNEDSLLLELNIIEEQIIPAFGKELDEWKTQWQEKNNKAKIIHTSYQFTENLNSSKLLKEQHISEDEFTAFNVFKNLIDKSINVEENQKEELIEAFKEIEYSLGNNKDSL